MTTPATRSSIPGRLPLPADPLEALLLRAALRGGWERLPRAEQGELYALLAQQLRRTALRLLAVRHTRIQEVEDLAQVAALQVARALRDFLWICPRAECGGAGYRTHGELAAHLCAAHGVPAATAAAAPAKYTPYERTCYTAAKYIAKALAWEWSEKRRPGLFAEGLYAAGADGEEYALPLPDPQADPGTPLRLDLQARLARARAGNEVVRAFVLQGVLLGYGREELLALVAGAFRSPARAVQYVEAEYQSLARRYALLSTV